MRTERFRTPESLPRIDFLSEKIRVQLSLDKAAAPHFPRISEKDLKTRKERFAVLLGKTIIQGPETIIVHIEAVLETTEEERGYYTEGVEHVSVNIPAIQAMLEGIRKEMPEYGELIGDVHTHPVMEKGFEDGIKPWEPSPEDIEDLALNYERGELDASRPYIFGIASPDDSGETVYSFYRLIKTKEGYSYASIEQD